jgi:NADH:ubiquinone oxidoreductase subunit 4 (subunit M)
MSLSAFDFRLVDSAAIFMVLMTAIVLYVSFFWSPSLDSRYVAVTLFFMFQFCVWVFISDRVFFVYLAYEASLLPILFIILK